MRSRARLRAPLGVILSQLATGCGAQPAAPSAVIAIPVPARAAAPAETEASVQAPTAASAPIARADADGDGVPDELDMCPKEAESATATEPRDGCPDRVIIGHTNPPPPVVILFGAGSAAIQGAAAASLDEVAATMQGHSEVLLVEIEGHTDTSGSPRAELSISQRRAEAVEAALVARGVDAGRLRAKGYGSFCPIAPNDGAPNRAKNRRVRFAVVKTTAGPTGASLGCGPAASAGIKPDPVP